MRSMGENLGELERVKEVLKGDLTHQFTDIINEAAAELNMDQADFQVLSFFWVVDSVAAPWHFGVDPDPDPRIHASWLMDPDSGSGSCYVRHWPSRCQPKTNFLTQFFLLITFWSYIYIIFQR